jgi:hypothetical protein
MYSYFNYPFSLSSDLFALADSESDDDSAQQKQKSSSSKSSSVKAAKSPHKLSKKSGGGGAGGSLRQVQNCLRQNIRAWRCYGPKI